MFGRWNISRRTMLRGLGAAVSLPFLDVMSKPGLRAAESQLPTTRMAYLYIPNGVASGAWLPEKVDQRGRMMKLNRWMRCLEPHREDITIFENMWTPRGNGHIAGTATWLTGGAFDGEKIDAGGVSVDQIVARQMIGKTLLPSLELSSKGEGIFTTSLPRNAISWSDRRTPVPRDIEPRVLFDRMFRAGESGLANKKVVDLVLADAKRLSRRVSDHDQKKLDEYLESIHAIERRIEFAKKQQARAALNPQLSKALVRPEPGVAEDHEAYMQTMMDMIVLAFWSDATRVASFMMDHGQSNRYFNFINGVRGTWHALSHWKDFGGKTEDDDGITSWDSRDQKREMYNRVTEWHTQQVAYLLNRLKSIDENGSSLLDNCMIVYGSSLGDGHEHNAENLPLLLAGRGGKRFDSGKLVKFGGKQSLSSLHLMILQSMGLQGTGFADAKEALSLS